MPRRIITLTTDFGLKDPYVAEMKAVILDISPSSTVVDITHQIEKFNVRMGAYVLASAVPYFPRGTIHVAVVDPSVGGKRQPILIKTKESCFVGPNNGVLALGVRKAGNTKHIRKITNRKMMLPNVSNTFHGRDIFAPAAAHIANGTSLPEFGPQINEIVTPEFAKVHRTKCTVVGEVIHIDDFGNIITNFAEKERESMKTKGMINLKIKDAKLRLRFCKAYADVKEQELLIFVGSHNFLEISINRGNAAKMLKAEVGNKITLFLGQL